MSSFDQSEQQQLFRHILAAMSYPGRVEAIESGASSHGAKSVSSLLRGVIITLVDRQVTLADPHDLVADDLWSWLGQSPAPADAAQYVVADPAKTPEFSPQVGTLESPEYGATIIMPVAHLESLDHPQASTEEVLYVSGPSRKNPRVRGFRVSPCHPSWLEKRQQWQEEEASFPLGTDWLLVSQDSIVAVPRSCQLLKECPKDKEKLDP